MALCTVDEDQRLNRAPTVRREPVGIWADCVRRISQGDQSAIAQLYDETKRMVFSVAFNILRDRRDAEEATLDVYLQVWRTSIAYDARRGTVAAWLLMMARSRAMDRLRARGHVAAASMTEIHDGLVSVDPNPEQANLAGADRARVRSALRTLSPEQRRAIDLAFFRGLTHRELAEHLGEPLGTVKTRIRAALHKLREALDPPYGGRLPPELPEPT
jgi:RNA polymerase sigma-70 factor, ECF subfamily